MMNAGWEDIQYLKYRASNNNNSTDAAILHRDVISYTNDDEILPIFTCVVYLDETIMELLPGSHKKNSFNNVFDALSNYYSNVKRIVIRPGDILLFNSKMIHRGIFTKTVMNRRVVQIFEIFPNRQLVEKYNPIFYHMPAYDGSIKSNNNFLVKLYKSHFITVLFGFITFFNSAFGYGYKMHNIEKWYDDKIYSSEATASRTVVDPNNDFQEINTYILNESITHNDLTREQKKYIKDKIFNVPFHVLVSLITLMILVAIIFLVYKIIAKIKNL